MQDLICHGGWIIFLPARKHLASKFDHFTFTINPYFPKNTSLYSINKHPPTLPLFSKVVQCIYPILMFVTTDQCELEDNIKCYLNKLLSCFTMKDTHYLKKNIRLRTTLYNSKSGFMKSTTNESMKTISANKEHAKSIKSFNKILTFQSSIDQTERYTNVMLTNTRIKFKSSRKLNASRLKKIPLNKRTVQSVKNVNLSHLQLSTKSWCLFDQKQKCYFGFREEYKREIASLTKIMTTILSIQIIHKLGILPNSVVRVTQAACSCFGTSANLRRDCWISLENLLYGTMLPSGNDAAYTLAEYLGYCLNYQKKHTPKSIHFANTFKMDLTRQSTTIYVLEFIQQMNALAMKIGLECTTFSNPHGLQNAMNISSAKDILKLSIYASKNKFFRRIANTQQHYYDLFQDELCIINNLKKWTNTNKLLWRGWEGVKTGLTPSAGSCLSSLKDGIYIVVLNCSTHETRFSDTEKLYEWYRSISLAQAKEQAPKHKNKRLSSQQMSIVELLSTDIQF